MKILLAAVNAKYIHSNLAVYSLKAYCREYRDSIEVGEYTINQQKDQVLGDIYRKKPDILCFSCYIWNISYVKSLIQDIKKILPDTCIWAGGPEVSYSGETFLEELPQVSLVMQGEGEETFRELVGAFLQDKEPQLENIPGIVYRQEGKVENTGVREILDMDRLVFPYKELGLPKHQILYYESSRGCPFSCSYCLSSIDKKLRFRSLSLVKEELQFFLDKKVPQVKFVDRTFNCKKEHALEIWRYLKDHDNKITNFHFEIAADLLTEEEIELISSMRPGLIQLEIGVQSTNEETLKEIRRKTSFSEIAKRVKAVKAGKNIHQHLDLIAGLPWEDYQSFRHSFNQVYGLKPQQLQLGFLKVLKGSYMAEMASGYGCLYKEEEPYEVLATRWLSYGEILRLKAVEEMVEVYYNSGQFSHTMEALEREFEDSFSMYEALGDFYRNRGYDHISHSRIRRYEILLEFMEERGVEDQEGYQQLMLLDLYIRENLKTRPSWAVDLKEYKEAVREFYKGEEEAPEILVDYRGYTSRQMEKMTHLEVFTRNVLGDVRERGCFPVLFDYKAREPLNHDARVVKVNLERSGEKV